MLTVLSSGRDNEEKKYKYKIRTKQRTHYCFAMCTWMIRFKLSVARHIYMETRNEVWGGLAY